MQPASVVATARKRAALHTLGCRLNQSETAIIADKLKDAGYDIVPFGEPADLGIINTCTVTNEADSKSRQLVRTFIRENPDAYTAVIGCYSQMGYKALSEIDGVDLVVGNQEKLNLLDYVVQGKNDKPLIVRDRIERDDFTIDVPERSTYTTRANLKIQDGCDFMCTFCIIPFARGRARTREFENLLVEARQMAALGVQEIILTGVNIGTYAHEGRSILDVVEALNAIPGVRRIRISSIEPTTIPDELLSWMNDPQHALTPYLHIPMQSGADHVVRLMKRKYTANEFAEFVMHAHETVKDLCIGTDILVGSPGESDTDFDGTCDLFVRLPIAYAHVFKYSERPGTPALRIPEKVDPRKKNLRAARLRKLSAEKRAEFNRIWLGRSVDVLFDNCEGDYWSGYTGNYMRVAVRSNEQLRNQILPVTLMECVGEDLLGELNGR